MKKMSYNGFNRVLEFLHIYNDKKYQTMVAIGEFCKSKMDYYVPVDSGYLKSRNSFKVTKLFYHRLRLLNDAFYAGFVEFGTSKMVAQPFIRPAQENHVYEIQQIIKGVYDDI